MFLFCRNCDAAAFSMDFCLGDKIHINEVPPHHHHHYHRGGSKRPLWRGIPLTIQWIVKMTSRLNLMSFMGQLRIAYLAAKTFQEPMKIKWNPHWLRSQSAREGLVREVSSLLGVGVPVSEQRTLGNSDKIIFTTRVQLLPSIILFVPMKNFDLQNELIWGYIWRCWDRWRKKIGKNGNFWW